LEFLELNVLSYSNPTNLELNTVVYVDEFAENIVHKYSVQDFCRVCCRDGWPGS